MLTIYGRATSSNVQLVMWTVAELGLEHERLDYGHVYGGTDTPDFRAMNPRGRVPVLKDGELTVFESCAIMRYLCAQYGAGTALWPQDPAERARIDQWAEFGKNELAQSFTGPIFWPRVRTAAVDRDEAALTQAIAGFEDLLDTVETALQRHTYICGDMLTTADITVGHLLYRWLDIDVPRKPRPLVDAYYARLASRPAYQTHVMVDYTPLRVEGA